MKTLQELYAEINGSDELKQVFAAAAKEGKIAEFLKAQGCEATPEEIKAFLAEKTNQPLSDDELDNVAGGKCNDVTRYETSTSILSLGIVCATMAITSAAGGHTGQKSDSEGRLCTSDIDGPSTQKADSPRTPKGQNL